MSLVNCPKCGEKDIYKTVITCPKCGFGVKSYFEKMEEDEKGRIALDDKRIMEGCAKEIPVPKKPSDKPLIISWIVGLIILCIGFFATYLELKVPCYMLGSLTLVMSCIAYYGCYKDYRKRADNFEKYKEGIVERRRVAKKYCEWLTKQNKVFIDKLQCEKFKPTWGFEVETENNILLGIGGITKGDAYIFDVPNLKGVAFDMESKQMLYFEFSSGYYNKYFNLNNECEYKYSLIPFSNIFGVNMDVEKETTISTTTSKENIIGRSIVGGLIAGDAGAIIGGTTGREVATTKTEITDKRIVFNIQTTYKKHPVISFEFNNNKSLADIMYGVFSKEKEKFSYFEEMRKRSCNTTTDCIFCRKRTIPVNMVGSTYLDFITKTCNLGVINKRVREYVMQIEAIIQQCDDDKEYDSKIELQDNIVTELEKLVDMKERGIITEEEFIKLKSKLI